MTKEREIVFYLMWRKKCARSYLRRAIKNKCQQEQIDYEYAQYIEISNSAEGARRILYGIDL